MSSNFFVLALKLKTVNNYDESTASPSVGIPTHSNASNLVLEIPNQLWLPLDNVWNSVVSAITLKSLLVISSAISTLTYIDHSLM
jgi:hypothetical protein